MTGVRISAMPAAAVLNGNEFVPIVQNGVTVRSTVADVGSFGGGGGGGSPAGPNKSVQYNNGGSFGGSAKLQWDDGTNTLTLGSTAADTVISTPANGAGIARGLVLSSGPSNSASTPPQTKVVGSNNVGAGNSGPVALIAGLASGAGNGGVALVQAGQSNGGGLGGNLQLLAGNSLTSGAGNVTISAGSGPVGSSGNVSITANTPTTGTGGTVTIQSGSSSLGDGGAITIQAGNADVTNNGGQVTIKGGSGLNPGTVLLQSGVAQCAQFDATASANNIRMSVWDVTAAALRRVTIGAADSGGAGFRVLRIPN